MEIIRKNEIEILELKIIITNENFTNRAQSRLEMAEESISECKDRRDYSI